MTVEIDLDTKYRNIIIYYGQHSKDCTKYQIKKINGKEIKIHIRCRGSYFTLKLYRYAKAWIESSKYDRSKN